MLTSCVSLYFNYRNAKEELKEGLDERISKLNEDEVKECDNLIRRFFNSAWILLDKYSIPENNRVTPDNLSLKIFHHFF